MSREARIAARKQKRAAAPSAVGASSSSRGWIALYGVAGSIGVFSWAVSYGRDSPLGQVIVKSYAWRWFVAQATEIAKPFSEPVRDKLLPDWPYFPNVPAGTPCPPTLVIDVEGTLCTSTWDPKYGWRHAKRPGVDKFLKELSRYFELVLFSSNPANAADQVVHALDKDQMVMHRLFREATKFHNGVAVKDLSHLNRDLKKVIIIDDDPNAYQLQPENAIHVSPYTDAFDKNDSTLENLVPFLMALVNEGVTDYPAVLRSFNTNEATDISNEYSRKLSSVKERQELAQTRGLGRLLRSIPVSDGQQRSLIQDHFAVDMATGASSAAVSTKKDFALSGPLAEGSKGRLWKSLSNYQKESEKEQRKKMEAFQEVMARREQEKKDKEEFGS